MNLDDLLIYDIEEMGKPYHTGKGGARKMENREFIAWDGEGITYPGNTQQDYVLFGNSKGFEISSQSLSTRECLDLMLETERTYPLGVHVGFAFTYDVEMILRDLPVAFIQTLHTMGRVYWQGYTIEFRKGKWFQVATGDEKSRCVCKIWDVFSFFSTSFVKALQEYLPDNEEVEFIASGKTQRNIFQYDELETMIRPYWQAELRTMVLLMVALRERLYGADLRITNWHGPGAIATYAMRKHYTHKVMTHDLPEEVSRASRFAYAGGRFEMFKIGHHTDKVYSYDIRSAYPSAIAHLPNLATGNWRHVDNPERVTDFGVYRIRFAYPHLFTTRPMPYPYRDVRSAVHFPNVVEGWYWSPEANIAQYLGGYAEILEGWEFDHDGSTPFEWVEEVYNTRAQWKREGNPSQIALKLLMNSMYGKFAQRVGFKNNTSPTWHQLEWAGWVTSHCRAKLYQAMIEAHSKNALLAVETDGIFTTEPLTHPHVGPNLGDWEADEYDAMVYLQSGFYFKRSGDDWIARCRGFDKGTVTVDNALSILENWHPWNDEQAHITGISTRFTTMGQYLRSENGEAQRRVWKTGERELNLGTDGKRIHRPMFCNACANQVSPSKGLHDMTVTYPVGGHTFPHILPWIPEDRINEFRNIVDGVKDAKY